LTTAARELAGQNWVRRRPRRLLRKTRREAATIRRRYPMKKPLRCETPRTFLHSAQK